ncbi:MAG: hypothetical protein JW741_19445 [Sedimentisphaerales bacterium]|nr:hypothetical protein [Sedimentisphaerales bacterium]
MSFRLGQRDSIAQPTAIAAVVDDDVAEAIPLPVRLGQHDFADMLAETAGGLGCAVPAAVTADPSGKFVASARTRGPS